MSICSTLITCYSICTEICLKSIQIVVLNSSLTEIFSVTDAADVSGCNWSVEFDYGLICDVYQLNTIEILDQTRYL